MMSRTPAHVVLRPIGSPLTVGMSGLAVASVVESGLDLGWIRSSQTADVGLVLLTMPFVLQLLACVFSYLARDGAVGAAVGVLATTWGAIGAIHVVSARTIQSGAMGLLLVSAGSVLALSAVAIALGKPLPAAVFLISACRFVLAGVYELGAPPFWRDLGGGAGIAVAALASYCVLAFELEGQRRAAILPTFRRGRGRLGASADLGEWTDGIAHEPGVRQVT